jgi:hypothetical protein
MTPADMVATLAGFVIVVLFAQFCDELRAELDSRN